MGKSSQIENEKQDARTSEEESSANGALTASASSGQGPTRPPKRKTHRVRIVVITVVIVLAIVCGAGVWAYSAGVLAPANAAAKYGTFDYLDEQDVTDYIMTYKEQMGYGDATDEEWAEFLAAYNLTPDRLRLSTISQLLSDMAIEQKCEELGIVVSDEEVDILIDTFRNSLGLTDDSIWEQTLDLYGQTEEGLRDVYRLELLRQKLCSEEVPIPDPTEDEVLAYIESYVATVQASEASNAENVDEANEILLGNGEVVITHSYKFVYNIAGDTSTLDESNQVQLVKDEFEESGETLENFVALLSLYCNDDETIETNGSMGWDADTTDFSETYLRELENVKYGGVSNVFTDGDQICFIWVDQTYTLPYDTDELDNLDLNDMPTSLYEYFSDCEAYDLWTVASQQYISDLVSSMDLIIYEMPSDVPYNVDMSAYLVTSDDADNANENSE